jgi:hypothetical protein
MQLHAIGVPEGITLLEFEGTCPEEQPPPVSELQVQAPEGVPEEEVVTILITNLATLSKRQAPEHYKPPNF